MKILSIGNSFSQDAQRWLYDIAATDGFELETVNLYIGGCSLEMHCNNALTDEPLYDMEGNGGEFIKRVSLSDALEAGNYDVITVQQASHFSGQPQTYVPYIIKLAEYVRAKQKDAKIYFHKTWSYETDSDHGGFITYNRDQKEMYRRLSDASEMASILIGAPIIPVGDAIQHLRENVEEFDYQNGGLSLCRDGFHLSFDYGRFTAAAVWYKTLTGRTPDIKKFAQKNPEFNIGILSTIIDNIK